MPLPLANHQSDKALLPAWFKTLSCLLVITVFWGQMLFALIINYYWLVFGLFFELATVVLSFVCQLVAVSWSLWIVFSVVQVLVKNNKLPLMAGMRWWTVSATFVHAAIIMGLFDEPFHFLNLGHGKPNGFTAWGQLLLGALLALPIGVIAFYAKRYYYRYRLKNNA